MGPTDGRGGAVENPWSLYAVTSLVMFAAAAFALLLGPAVLPVHAALTITCLFLGVRWNDKHRRPSTPAGPADDAGTAVDAGGSGAV